MHDLIRFKLEHAHTAWKAERDRRATKNDRAPEFSDSSESESDVGSDLDGIICPGSLEDSADGFFVRCSSDKVERAKARLKTVSSLVFPNVWVTAYSGIYLKTTTNTDKILYTTRPDCFNYDSHACVRM